jgi:Four helix bundle sensory module for signal transduction
MLNRPFPFRRALCTGLLLLVAAIGFFSLNRVKTKTYDIVTDTLPGLADAGMADSDSAEDVNFILLALMASTPEQKAQCCAQADAFETDAAKHLKLYEDSIFQKEDRSNFNRTMERRKEFLELRGQVVGLMNRGADKEALAQYKKALLPCYDQYMADGKVMLDYNVRQGQTRGQGILRFSSLTQYAVGAFTIALFILGFAVGIFKFDPTEICAPRPVVQPMQKIVENGRRLRAEG